MYLSYCKTIYKMNFKFFRRIVVIFFILLPTPRTFLGFLRQSSSTGGQPCQKMRWTLLPLTKKTISLSTSASKINKKTKFLSISASRSTKRQNLRQYLRLDQPKDKIFVIIGVKNQQKHKIFVNIGLQINKKTKSLSTLSSRSTKDKIFVNFSVKNNKKTKYLSSSASTSTKTQNLCNHWRQDQQNTKYSSTSVSKSLHLYQHRRCHQR